MILYNVTVQVTKDIEKEYIDYMVNKHIPDVMETGFFTKYEMLEVLTDDPEGVTFAIKYHCDSMEHFNEYQNKCAKALQEEHHERYKDKFVAYRTLMRKIAG